MSIYKKSIILLILLQEDSAKMQTKILKINSKSPQISKIRQASKIIKSGNLVAFPTETVYGLGAKSHTPTIYTIQWRGERDLNPRVIADMGLAIPRPTKLGDPRTDCLGIIRK